MVSHAIQDYQDYARWPGLASRPVNIGGVTATYAEAAAAARALARAGGIMVRQVLLAAGSPLAGCDYHAAAAPFREAVFRGQFPASSPTGRGAAGRPATKQAFIKAIEDALCQAELAEPARHFADDLARAREAFGSDAGYAAAMAAAAVQHRRDGHSSRLRAMVTSAAREAVAACEARAGEFSCAAVSACGTGDCRLARGVLAGLADSSGSPAPAGPGRLSRPANHAQSGRGFGTVNALQALEKAIPFTVGVHVSGAASARGAGSVAA